MRRAVWAVRELALVAALISNASAKVSEGNLRTKNDWSFLEKFAFDNTGNSEVWIDVKANRGPETRILLYNDKENEWPQVYGSTLPCLERLAAVPGRYLQPLTTGKWERFLYKVQPSVRQHFWYIAIANCGHEIDLEYRIVFLNSAGSHFSYDESGLDILYEVFAGIFILGVPFIIYLVRKLRRRQLFTKVIKLLLVSYALQTVSCLAYVAHFGQYSKDGKGLPAAMFLGRGTNVISTLLFILTLYLLSNGYSISTQKLNHKKWLFGLMAVYATGYIAISCWEALRDKATTVYLYEGPPGLLLLVLNLVALGVCSVCLARCHAFEHHSKSKRRFYRCFGGCFLCWFLFLPLQVFVAHFLDPWVRRKSVEALSTLLTWMGYLLIPFLSNPRQAYELYHDRKNLAHSKVPSLSKMQRIIPSLSGFDELPEAPQPAATPGSTPGATPSSAHRRSEHFERALQQSYEQAQQQLAQGGDATIDHGMVQLEIER